MADDKPIFLQQLDDRFIPNDVPPSPEKVDLPEDIKVHVREWNKRYPAEQKRSGVFEALRVVQVRNGYLTVPLMDAVAELLEIPPIAVYEVAAFYTLYSLKPTGEHVIYLCTNVSCMLNGSEELMEHLEEKLGVKVNQTTADGKFTLREVECLGACVSAPVCQINKLYHEKLTVQKLDELLSELA